jgi:phosphoribosylformylglycinamidine (FGAM) synthase PurS component
MSSVTFRVDVTPRVEDGGMNGRSYLQAAHQLGYTQLTGCHAARIYFLQGQLSANEAAHIAAELLADPVTEEFRIYDLRFTIDDLRFTIANSQFTIHNSQFTIDVSLLPGVTDPPAENLVKAAHLLGVTGLGAGGDGAAFLPARRFG